MRRPSGENTAPEIRSLWPCNVTSSWPLSAFHTRAVRSALAVRMRWPSGENTALETKSLWPCSVASSWPLVAFHTDPESVVQGERVDLGGGGIIKTKKASVVALEGATKSAPSDGHNHRTPSVPTEGV